MYSDHMFNIQSNDCLIEKGTINDIDPLEVLYDKLNDYLESGTLDR